MAGQLEHDRDGVARAAGGGASSLVLATKLVPDPGPGWVLGLYPDAAEASGTFQYRVRLRRDSTIGPAIDPDRSSSEAARRAGTKLRRYVVANALDRLGTLTYAGEGVHDERACRGHVREFFRALRGRLGGEALPYVWVPEWHESHGLHVHFVVGRFVPQPLIRDTWGRGIVDIRRLRSRQTVGPIAASRRAAGYVGKYVAKSFAQPRTPGLHRYEVAQGFQPRVERIVGATREEVIALAAERMGRSPAWVWNSDDQPDWQGPPAVSVRFND